MSQIDAAAVVVLTFFLCDVGCKESIMVWGASRRERIDLLPCQVIIELWVPPLHIIMCCVCWMLVASIGLLIDECVRTGY